MVSFEMLPNEENLIQAICDDVLNRNKDLVYFNELLMSQEGARAIAIDGRWGSGKTFFVRQSVLTINALNPSSILDEEKREKITHCLPFGKTNKTVKEKFNLAVYYDAWENDNDTDPVLSIIYEISKQLGVDYKLKDKNVFKIAGAIAEILSGRNVDGIIESLKSNDPLVTFQEQKKLEQKIKEFFSELLVERGNRLVVFIDELDRCKPNFAVHLLEQIKHYLCDDRITFIFSVNIEELQHTIKHYYGESFDACRYLDRFFDITITLPPADMTKFYDKLEMNTGYVVEKVCKRLINMYHFELREITHFYRLVKTAIFGPTHDSKKYGFDFPEEKAKKIIMIYIVPVIIGLRIVDISLHDKFVDGKDCKPLVELFDTEELNFSVLGQMLDKDEAFKEDGDKKIVTKLEIVKRLYDAIFANKYSAFYPSVLMGEYEFNAKSKEFAIRIASMMSRFADYQL